VSDAIRLIVSEDGPTRIAVGEADPVARREIAELQEDVAEIQGDVTTLQEDVADIEERLDDAVQPDGTYPALTSGAALSLTSPTAAESTWAQRVTDAVDGVAMVDGILGNTVVQDGSLLSVQMEGIETNGFNQWDEEWEKGSINWGTGANASSTTRIRSKGYIPVFPSTKYYARLTDPNYGFEVCYYDEDKTFISGGWVTTDNASKNPFTTPANCRYIRFSTGDSYGGTYNHDICINLSGPRNGTYKPYATYQRTIPAATYFPNGMRSAGTVHDELTADAAIVRVGAVDLGTLTWARLSSGVFQGQSLDGSENGILDKLQVDCASYTPIITPNGSAEMANRPDKSIALQKGYPYVFVNDSAYTDAATFKTAVDGVMLHYLLATPTTTPIDPPLNLTYRVEQGGTESVMHTDPTAAPTWRTRYPFDLAGTVMANIAPVEQPVATATHAIGDLLCVGWQLYRVTRAIAIGEAITAGTNVTATTVAAEIAAIQ